MSLAENNAWPDPGSPDGDALRALTAALEAIVADRGLLGALTEEERTRLLAAAGDVFNPDLAQRRRWGKAVRRREKAAQARPRRGRARRDRHPRAAREAGVHDAERLPARRLRAGRGRRRARVPRGRSSRSTATSASSTTPSVHPFYDQLCPRVRRLQLREAHRDGRPARPRRAAHRRAREDRLPGRDQAAARRRAR